MGHDGEHEDAGCGIPAAPGAPSSSYSLLPISEATQIILKTAKRLEPVSVSLDKALGTILAEDVHAPEPLPPFPASIKVSVPASALLMFLNAEDECSFLDPTLAVTAFRRCAHASSAANTGIRVLPMQYVVLDVVSNEQCGKSSCQCCFYDVPCPSLYLRTLERVHLAMLSLSGLGDGAHGVGLRWNEDVLRQIIGQWLRPEDSKCNNGHGGHAQCCQLFSQAVSRSLMASIILLVYIHLQERLCLLPCKHIRFLLLTMASDHPPMLQRAFQIDRLTAMQDNRATLFRMQIAVKKLPDGSIK